MSDHQGRGTARPKRELQACRSDNTDIGCTVSKHGTRAAYVLGCRCDTAIHAHYRYEKQLRAEHKRGQRRRVDVTGSRRRLQALCAIGYSQPDLADLLGVTQQRVWQYLAGPRPTVLRSTAEKIDALYVQLADRPSRNRRAVWAINTARRNGWLPPLWWDDDTIDDPAVRSGAQTSSDVCTVDPVVVERLLDGQPPLHVTRAERVEAVRLLDSRGVTVTEISRRLRMSGGRVTQILAERVLPSNNTHADDNDRQEASA